MLHTFLTGSCFLILQYYTYFLDVVHMYDAKWHPVFYKWLS